MILKAFSFLDTKTGMFNTPFFMAHTGQALRACIDLASDNQTTIARHPNDFMLCDIGTFDDQTGVLSPCMPIQLGTVASFLPSRPQPGLFEASSTVTRPGADGSIELMRSAEHANGAE